jgi:hypothetical protein
MDLLMVANGCIMAPEGGFSYGCKLGASQLLKMDLIMVANGCITAAED